MSARYMTRAVELAERAHGRTSPNPAVGAVIVRDGTVVGEGVTQPPGQAHAEVMALNQAGSAALDADLYVTLEPCSFQGRTPPCTDAIIAAGIRHVHVGVLDPHPQVNGQGVARLRAAGIHVSVGVQEAKARRCHEAYLHSIRTGLPFVTLKMAMSIDGKVAAPESQSTYLTGKEALAQVHELRDRSDAIVVGVNTVIADDPRLTTRLERADVSHPRRYILDSRGRTPLTARVLDPDLPGESTVVTTDAVAADALQAFRARAAGVWSLPADDGRVDLSAFLQRLSQEGVCSVLLEGGPTLAAAFLNAKCVQKLLLFVAPLLVGSEKAPSLLGDRNGQALAAMQRFHFASVKQIGQDVLLTAYLRDEGDA
jgi:diaminohydroxyphosphoribosylaminopyrimidine deaminase/5-amino-6-(5-phosphoribosylamino)uracil reductase